jgi:signal transduction histidine kinase
MAAEDEGGRPSTLTVRFRKQAVAVLGVLLALAIILDRVLERSFADQLAVRVALGVGFGVAALTALLALVFVARSVLRPVRTITASVERIGRGEPGANLPEHGADELAGLAETVNRMRRDVEERIETVRREQETREAILAALGEGVVLFDRDGTVLYRNGPAEELLGPGRDEASKLLPFELRELVERSRKESASRQAQVTTARDRTFLAITVPVSAEGQILLVLRDITHDRRVEAVRREFVSNASHELKTPVASIRALAETIAASLPNDPEATGRFVAQLETEAVRLSRIISDLLDLSRLEAEAGERVPVRFDDIVAEEVRRFEPAAREAGLSLTVTRLDPAEVMGSAADLSLLVRNLVANATQYTRPGGDVEVSLAMDEDTAVLTVRDTGIGIPTRDQDRVFERFYRVDRARSRETGGTGLGLSIVKHVVENHGGSVLVRSELGRGSSFVIRIPTAPVRETESILPRP